MIDVEGLLAAGRKGGCKVGIGLAADAFSSTEKLIKSNGGRIELVRFDDPHGLAYSLKHGRIDAAVRGTMSSTDVLREIKHVFGIHEVMRTAVLLDHDRKAFLLTPVGIDEGKDIEARLAIVRASVEYFSPIGWKPKIGILSKGRVEDFHRGEDIRLSIEDGEKICAKLKGEGLDATHYTILIEQAVKECDLVLAPSGVTGNLIFRALHFVGGTVAYGAPVVNLKEVFVDTSRAKKDFSDSVYLAAGLVAAKAKAQPHA